jgi:peptidoglycan hydrolase-like protein with peptidoglycan-binding domain
MHGRGDRERPRRWGLALGVLLASVVAPSAASAAQGPLLSLTTEQVGRDAVTLVGQPWRVRVVMQPWVEGQTATVRFYRHGKRIAAVPVTFQPSKTGKSGMAVVPFTSKLPARVEVRASHLASPQLGTLVAKPVRVTVAALHAKPGARGPAVRLLQSELASLGYVVGKRGLFDDRTGRAVLAFRKVTGLARTTNASSEVFKALSKGKGRFKLRHPEHGKHVEADLSRQVIALARGGKVERIYPISSGKPSTPTVIGSFRVYTKSPGYNAKGMFFSNYFIRGYAIHGYASVPVFAASHGCLRVPIPDAISIYNWLRVGNVVDVYP